MSSKLLNNCHTGFKTQSHSDLSCIIFDENNDQRQDLSKKLYECGVSLCVQSGDGFTTVSRLIEMKPDILFINPFIYQNEGQKVMRRLRQSRDIKLSHMTIISLIHDSFDMKETVCEHASMALEMPVYLKDLQDLIRQLRHEKAQDHDHLEQKHFDAMPMLSMLKAYAQ